jgi:CHAT domain-containing protein/tetratricopeptide (TPR) repeat protein
MSSQNLIQQLLALPEPAAQWRFLEKHVHLLDDQAAYALKEQADQFLRADLHRALQAAELLLHLAELTANPLHRALGLLATAHARSFGGLGEYEQAIALLDEAAGIYRAHDHPVDEARAQIGKIWSLAQLGRYGEALETGEWASRVLEENAEWLLLAKLTVNLGVIHRRLREDATALALYDQARDLYNRLGPEGEALKALARLEQNRSTVLRNLGRFDPSIQASQAALEMLTRSGQQAGAARARQNLAVTYFILGRYNEALELLDQARSFFLADGRLRDAILAELFVSDCLLQLGRFTDVLDKCGQIRELFTELGTRLEVAQAFLNEAVAYAGLRRYAQALVSLDEARRMFEEEDNDVWVACTDLEKAAVLYRRGQLEESLQVAQECAQVFKGHDLPIEAARAYLAAARAAAALNRHDQARCLATESLAVGESKNVPSLTYQSHHLLGTLALAQSNAQEALAECDRAIEELERLRGRLMVEFRADFLEDKQAVYEDMVCLCLDLDQPRRGLEYAERAKSRALLDLLAYRLDLGVETRGAEDRCLVEELMRLRAQRDQLYRRWESQEDLQVRGGPPFNEGRHEVQQDVLALEKRITELWHRLLIRNADYARDACLWQVRTEPVQPYLAPDTLLLEYFIAHQELVVFLVTASAVQARRLPIDLARVQRLVQLLWLNLRAVPRTTSSQVSALATNARGLLCQLYELLIGPLGDALAPYSHLIVVPHGPLHYLPFHALYDGRTYLLERHEISHLPGASVLRYCCEAHPAASGLLAFGHSYGGRLPHAVQEARSIAKLSGGQAFLEERATPARLREAAADCHALHLAAHGDFRPDNPLFSGLALADGWLTTLDIFNLRLNASLVTLSACQTGCSVVGGGDELLGLMRAFLYAGTASLVLSLWAVEDRSTAHLMETLYRKLAQGWRKGAALRYAQMRFIEGQGPDGEAAGDLYSHPYFWAPFFLVGDAGPL